MKSERIVAIAGEKEHGKDTAAKVLIDQGYTLVKFAEPLKEMLRTLLRIQGCPEADIERYIEGDLKGTPCVYLNGRTMRHAMVTLGTEWGREMIDQGLWTAIWRRRVDRLEKSVTTDLRFPNEVEAVSDVLGYSIRVVNPRKPQAGEDAHPSESQVKHLLVDTEILNDGTIPDLHAKVLEKVHHLEETAEQLKRAGFITSPE